MVGGPRVANVETVVFVRDYLMVGVVFGMASFAWFGWGQEDPPRAWRTVLGIGSALGAALALASGFFAWQNWSWSSPPSSRSGPGGRVG